MRCATRRIPAMPIWRGRLEWIARVKPRRAILTNMHVDLDYETLRRELPPGVEPAFDGMSLDFSASIKFTPPAGIRAIFE